jgi:hypothetical protein
MTDNLSLHLTQPNAELGKLIAATPSGMAFWAGTGPANTTCRECMFFDHQKSYYAKKGIGGGSLNPARCKKYSALANRHGDKIEHGTRACKYFERAEVVPPITSK